MVQSVTTLDELKGHTLEDLLYEVVRSRESLTVVLEEGGAVVISPEVALKPLHSKGEFLKDGRVPSTEGS